MKTSGTAFWVLMVKRSDKKVYPDMHKVPDQTFFLTKEEAVERWQAQGDLRKSYHVVELVAYVADP